MEMNRSVEKKPEFHHEVRSHVWKDAILPLGEPCKHNRWLKRFRFRENIWSFFEKSFDGHGDPWMHLIVGPEKALLIDNGFGIGDLASEIRDIIGDMPLYVTNTHPSIDHARGNSQFNEIHVLDKMIPYLEKDNPHQWDKLFDQETGKGIWQDFDKSEIVPFRQVKLVSCENHFCFDLGEDYEVEMIHMPGHHAAHTVFLDKKNRILFGGDVFLFVCSIDRGNNLGMPYDEYGTVEGLRDELRQLIKRMDEFDVVFMSHMILGEDKQIVKDLYQACCDAVSDPDSNQYEKMRGGMLVKTRAYGVAALEYVDSRVYKSQITHGKPTFQHEWQSMVWGSAIVPLAKHYDICPYAQVYQFHPGIWSIRIRTVWVSVIIGPEKAMVIDAGYGVGDLKGLIHELIGDMELIVVNTHTHGDHTLGNVQFGKVYMHKYGIPTMEKYQQEKDERKWRYYNEPVKALQRFMKNNGAFEEKDMIPFRPYEMVGCENHTIFNLGGDHDIELIYLPGHDYSGCVFLDKKNRILFGGDSLLYVAGMGGNRNTPDGRPPKMPYSEYACVEAFHNELKELVKRMDEFDCIYMGHMIQGADKRLVTDMYECTKYIMNDPAANPYVNVRKDHLNRVVAYGEAAVEYCDTRVYIDQNRTAAEK